MQLSNFITLNQEQSSTNENELKRDSKLESQLESNRIQTNISSLETYSNLKIEKNKENRTTITNQEEKRIIFVLKILYFISGMFNSAWYRFSQIYYKNKGLSVIEMGRIESTLILTTIISHLILSYLSDKLRNKRKVFLYSFSIGTLLMTLLAFDSIHKSEFFRIYFIVIIRYPLSQFDFLTAYSIEILGSDSKKWGQLRLWLAISYGFFSFFFFFVYDIYKSLSLNILLLSIIGFLYVLIIVKYLPSQTISEKTNKELEKQYNFSEVLNVINSKKYILFIFEIFVIMLCFGYVEKYMFIYFIYELHGSITIAGVTVIITVLFEIPIFHYSEKVLQKTSFFVRLIISMTSHLIRMIGYISITDSSSNFLLLFECFHGITYVFVSISITERIKRISPPHIISTITNITNSLCYLVSYGCASFTGGYIMEKYNGRFLYEVTCYIIVGLFIFHCVVAFIQKNKMRRNEKIVS